MAIKDRHPPQHRRLLLVLLLRIVSAARNGEKDQGHRRRVRSSRRLVRLQKFLDVDPQSNDLPSLRGLLAPQSKDTRSP